MRPSLHRIHPQEFDGSDSGAKPDEAISWGKIKIDANPVKVCAEATLVFPLIVSQTFAKDGPKMPIASSKPSAGNATTPEAPTGKEGAAAAQENPEEAR